MSTTHLKRLCTRYTNIVEREVTKGKEVLDKTDLENVQDQDLTRKVKEVTLASRRLKEFSEKLEDTVSDLSIALEEKNEKDELAKFEADSEKAFSLIEEATMQIAELTLLEEILKERKPGTTHEETTTTSAQMEQLINTQTQMQEQVMRFQQLQIDAEQRQREQRECSVNLPKLDLVNYGGDKLKWSEFWDSFETAVHRNTRLSKIDKFNYLKTKLYGEAKTAISGLALSNDNYDVAVDTLKERFGESQTIINKHYMGLINTCTASNQTTSLRKLYNELESHLRCLEALSQDTNQEVFISMITSKLPREVLVQLELQKGSREKWTVVKLRELLNSYVTAREAAETQSKEHRGVEDRQQSSYQQARRFQHGTSIRQGSSAEALLAASPSSQRAPRDRNACICRYCEGNHWSDECTKVKTVEDRKKCLGGSCHICLKPGHQRRQCRIEKACFHCKQIRNHHRSLCPKKFPVSREMSQLVNEFEDGQPDEIVAEKNLLSSGDIVLMQTAHCMVTDTGRKETAMIRLLMDSGSQRTYVTESLAKRLKLPRKTTDEVNVATFGAQKSRIIRTPRVTLNLKLKDDSFMTIDANVVPKITSPMQRRPIKTDTRQNVKFLLKEVQLADTLPKEVETSTIDILLGNDYYLDILLPNKMEVERGLYLLSSKVGWILAGRSQQDSGTNQRQIISESLTAMELCLHTAVDSCVPTFPPIEDFWNLEAIGIKDSPFTLDDERVHQNFKETLRFEDGRYQVSWPWKNKVSNLPENRELAYGRLKSLVNRLKKTPELLQKYDETIKDQLEKGIIEKATNTYGSEEDKGVKHYIPHHAVVDPTKATTKVRIVYDASAKTRQGDQSLNECMYRGPVLLQDLCGLLLRFRLNRIAVVADIEKAFLQVSLHQKDRDATRFFWLKNIQQSNIDDNIQVYRFTRVPFGVISSPFLLAGTIDHHLGKYGTPTAEKIRRNVYVDNVITGVETVTEAESLYRNAKKMFNDMSMNLREWASNSTEFTERIPVEDKASGARMKVLGITWNMIEDVLSVNKMKTTDGLLPVTKREVLQTVASIYDPLGYFTPVVLRAKMFLQMLWDKRLDWDDQLEKEDAEVWNGICTDLEMIPEHQIPRCIIVQGKVTRRLLCFCDASAKAYACCIYLHQADENNSRSDLIFSKTRLAPRKKISLPRLELMAVLIGVRCIKFVAKELDIVITEKILWTDSQCVLHWIKTRKPLTTFVENRLKEIREQNIIFNYIRTKENPADVASRGTTVPNLRNGELWWKGPGWLSKKITEWPKTEISGLTEKDKNQVQSEYKKTKSSMEANLLSGESPNGKNRLEETDHRYLYDACYKKYSTFTRLVRVTAWMMRFIMRLKKRKISGPLTAAELELAKLKWIKVLQDVCFAEIKQALTEGKRNNLVNQLGLTMDEDGIIRCTGRLSLAELSEGARRPILLPKRNPVTTLIIEEKHKRLFHAGVSQTLSAVRQDYWIPQGRSEVRRVTSSCTTCRRYEGGPYKMPLMPPIPRKRVNESPPFTFTGVDYFGPLFIKTENGSRKVWICLYTCLVIRAVHLEVMLDMTAEQFLLGFRRFVARFGKPKQVISDNGSQFKLSGTVIKQLWNAAVTDDDVQSYVANDGIQWQFIVELAPWMGGFYERLVGVVKRGLRKTIGRLHLNVEQLRTVITECEAVVNSRPLVYVGEDLNSTITLTPMHFLTLNPKTGIPDTMEDDDGDPNYYPEISSAEKLLSLWKKGQKLVNVFWKIWRDEYLLSLRERYATKLKGGKVTSKIDAAIGDVVLIKDDLPRGSWRIGRITKLIVSTDGQTRSCEVTLPNKRTLNRALNLVFPLECSVSTDNSLDDEEHSKRSDILQGNHKETNIVPERINSDNSVTRPTRKSKEKAKELFKDISKM